MSAHLLHAPSGPGSDPHAVHSALLRRLGEALQEAGGELRSPSGGWDGLVVLGKHRFPVELKFLKEPRKELLQALLADAVLRGRARARSGERFVAVVGAGHLSSAMAQAIEVYAHEVAPGQPFGYLDERGLVRLFAPGLESVRQEPARRVHPSASFASPRDLFSDLNQWLLKVLLGGRLPEGLIQVPRLRVGSAAALAEVARVSGPAAWRLQAALKAEGYLEEASEIVRPRVLLARWRAAALRPQRQVGAVWVMPGRDPLERLRRALADQPEGQPLSGALGLFAACDLLGVGHVRGAPVHVYVRELDGDPLGRLGLALAPKGRQPDVLLRVARWPEAVFRAAVRKGGVPAADVIQCWLDVSAEPTRGAEQAAFIWRRVLGPALAGGKPQP